MVLLALQSGGVLMLWFHYLFLCVLVLDFLLLLDASDVHHALSVEHQRSLHRVYSVVMVERATVSVFLGVVKSDGVCGLTRPSSRFGY